MNILLVILLFSVLILIHELGHFVAAKKFGVKIEEFGLGYPPRIFGFYKKDKKWIFIGRDTKKKIRKIDKTIYSLNWIPFGGFLKIFGENREEKKESSSQKSSKKQKKIRKDSFEAQSALKRSIIILNGVFFNVIFAMLLLIIMFASGAPVVSDEETTVPLKNEAVIISEVVNGSPASEAGLSMGDKILDVAIFGEDGLVNISAVEDVQNFTNNNKGEKIVLTIQRGGEIIEKEIIPRVEFPEDEGPMGIAIMKTGIARYPWYEAIKKGVVYTFQLLQAILFGFYTIFKSLLTKGKMVGQVAGPVGIFQLTSQAASMGISYFIHFGAMISLNLAVLNALPIPALDGGRFLFILIEKIKGSPISAKVERVTNSAAFLLLILLMIFITIRDIIKIF